MLLQNKRIMYIEDDARNRKLVDLILTSEGARVWFERWGAPALSLTAVLSYMPLDIILLDLMFPHGFSGYDVYRILRQQSPLQDVPLVVVSAADPSVEMPKARSLGIANYIAKPIDATCFAQQIQDIIAGTRVWHAS
jgi:CheY-like chemotaxis protein